MSLQATGKPLIPPLQVQALIDTACDVTAIASWIPQRLGLVPGRTVLTQTAGGPVRTRFFNVSLSITEPNQANAPWFVLSDLLVTELVTALPDAEVLIGLDVLLQCKLLLDGPAYTFTLEF